jgi:transcriptional regulator, Rrf2 family
MRVSKGVEWALHTALLLAQAPEGSWTARRTIAEFYDLPEPYLAKYLQRLVAAGVLVATTGPRGGYRLAAPPGEITALAVFEAIEGSAPVFTCQDIRRQGRGAATDEECQRECIIHTLVDSADAAWRAQLAGKTVADLVGVLPNTLKDRTSDILSEATSGASVAAKRRR